MSGFPFSFLEAKTPGGFCAFEIEQFLMTAYHTEKVHIGPTGFFFERIKKDKGVFCNQ
jgi:hypothetical protein